MRKNLFLFVLAFVGIAGTVFGQTPATLPYSCDFESPGDNGWTLKNKTCTNQWHIGTPSGAESASLFISDDGGTTAGYDITKSSIVVAEKLFQTDASDSLTISFDLTIGGDSQFDFLKVFWVPADTNYEAIVGQYAYYVENTYTTNVIMSNASSDYYRYISELEGMQRMSATIANEPNSLKKLVFVWKNDNDHGSRPGAIIDNIEINKYCRSVTDLVISNVSHTEATVSWTGSATNYEVRLNNDAPELVIGTSKTFTGLTPGEPYSVQVRAICVESHSQWESKNFTTPQHPASIPYFCDFESANNNGWILKNGTYTNQWHIGTFNSPAGHSGSLYISADGGATAGYDTTAASLVVVEKLFQTGTSDSLTISFDLSIKGEDRWDYVKVFWTPADTNYETTDYYIYYAHYDYAPNAIMSNATDTAYRYVCNLESTQRMNVTIANEPNSLKKLVFVWKNDYLSGSNPSAIIDNLSITENSNGSAEPCDVPTGLSVSNITETGATLSWNGEASTYEIKLNGGAAETVSGTSKTLTGLAENTVYMAEVRAICEEGAGSAWVSITFRTLVPTPVLNTFEATEITASSATLNGRLNAKGRPLTTKGFEYRKQGSEDWTELVVASTIENISFALTNLEAATTYEYRVMAKTEENTYTGNIVLFTTLETTGLAEVEHSVSAVVYPNPAKDKAVLRLSGLMEDARLIVGDIQGKIVLTDSIAKGSERYELDLKGFASGVYSVTIVSGNNKATHKLIVE